MGEQNCTLRRAHSLDRRTLVAAAAIYEALFGCEVVVDGVAVRGIEASFNVLGIGAWAPSSVQAKPAPRGSQTHSFADLPSTS